MGIQKKEDEMWVDKVRLIAESNGWSFAFALGYYNGLEDAVTKENTQGVTLSDKTDFGHGYCRALRGLGLSIADLKLVK